MTEIEVQAPESIPSFDERVEILAGELELAVKWQRPCILLVVYRSEYVRAEAQTALENHMFDMGQRSVPLRLKNREITDIAAFLKEFEGAANAVFFVDGFRRGKGAEAALYSMLNIQREFFAAKQIRTVFWLTQNELTLLAHSAPDFWAYRDRVIAFVESPKAEQLLQRAVESAWQGTGEYVEAPQDTDASISLRESLLTDLPRGEEASSIRANLLLALGVLNWRKGDFEKADEQLQEALQIAGKLQDAWFEAECFNALALIRASTERIEEAIDAYRQAIQLAPNQIFAWNNLGNLCAKIGRHDEAMTAFQKAIDGNPKDPIAWNGLGGVHLKNGRVDEAIAAYRKAIEYLPSFAQPWNGLGDVYASIDQLDEALKTYHEAVKVNPKYVTPWIRMGTLFLRHGKLPEAVTAYQGALALDPNNSALWNDLGTMYGKSERLAEAVDTFSKAIQLDRGNGWAYSNLAFTYMQQGRHREAISLLLRSLDLLEHDADKAASWNHLAQVYRRLHDYDNATAAYQIADRLDPAVAASKPTYMQNGETPWSATSRAEGPEPTMDQEMASAAPFTPAAASVRNAFGLLSKAASASEQRGDSGGSSGVSRTFQTMTNAPSWIFHGSVTEAYSAPQTGVPQQAVGYQGEEDAMTDTRLDRIPSFEQRRAPEDVGGADGSFARTGGNSSAAEWTERGNTSFSGGALDDAIQAYNEAIRLDPALGAPYSNLASAYLTRGQFAEAIALYQKSVELLDSDKEKALSWNGLGNAYRCVNDYPSAVNAYQRAADLDPETNGIRERAEDFLSPAAPMNAQVWNDLGEFFLKIGSEDEAIEAFNKAIELKPDSGLPYCNLSRALAATGKYTEAVPLCQKGIALLTDDMDKTAAWNHLGNVFRKLNDYERAIDSYQRAAAGVDEGVDLLTRTGFSLLSNSNVNQ